MKKSVIIVGTLIFLGLLHMSWNSPVQKEPAVQPIRNWIREELKNTQHYLSLSIPQLNNVSQLKKNYHAARKHYKHVEFFVEYYSPREAKYFINGPLVPKVDNETSSEPFPPQGFQRLEELLFSEENLDTSSLNKEYQSLLLQLSTIENYYQHVRISEEQLLEMCQWELFRIASMNLNGYDATITLTSVKETEWCLEGIEKVIRAFQPYTTQNDSNHQFDRLTKEITKSKKYLHKHSNYNRFNRLAFITDYINPLNKSIVEFHNLSKIPWTERRLPIKLNEGFLFGKESFNVQYFAMNSYDTTHYQQQAQLGKLLFFDPVLSGNNKRACASCHQPKKAFTDGLPKNKDFSEMGFLSRNTPGLLNVIYQKAFFYDGRAIELEKQIMDVVHSKNEMQGDLDEVVNKLRRSNEYKQLFKEAFMGSSDTAITSYSIQRAITQYEKALISLDSRFDKYLHGNKDMLSTREIDGYNLFAGKALCGSCHFFPLFNGTVPPFFRDSEFEVIGTPEDAGNKRLDSDEGRFSFTRIEVQKHAFKTPTVRNSELTAPYMHNGVYATLEEVIEFYHKGGGAGFNFEVPNQTLPFDSLKLSPKEKQNIVLFLKTLTDTVGLTRKPDRLPLFDEDLLLNKRTIGGEY